MHIGDVLYREFRVPDPAANGANVDADSLPTAILRKNGVTVGAASVTVAKISTGYYSATVTIDAAHGWTVGDRASLHTTYAVAGDSTTKALGGGIIREAKTPASIDWDEDVANPPTIGTAMAGEAAAAVVGLAQAGEAAAAVVGLAQAGEAAAAVVGLAQAGEAATAAESVKLAADGLDAIPIDAPDGVATTFRGMIVQTWRRFFCRATRSDSELKTYLDDDTVATTQAISIDGSDEEQGAAS